MRVDPSPFITRFDLPLRTAPAGRLAGMTTVVKDNIDVAGYVSGAGCPEYAADHEPASRHAPVVRALLDAGAAILGKAHMDELAFSLTGADSRYVRLPNPAAPGRVPGGSSSGSAVAVAAGLADIGVGTDTGGSVRVPASFCGLFGWRPTHGALPLEGVVPFASSYDTVGFLARDAGVLQALADVFLPASNGPPITNFWMPEDVWRLADVSTVDALSARCPFKVWSRNALFPQGTLAAWQTTFRINQGYEIWRALGDWISRRQPALGQGAAPRFAWTSTVSEEQYAAAKAERKKLRERIALALPPNRVMVYPTTPGPALRADMSREELEAFRSRAMTMCCIAGNAGLPQVSLPLARVGGAPVGLSIVGAPGTDRQLIALAAGACAKA